ncbi:MAG: CHAP domain-containing protein [Candidatus Moranbacteria bacterium]|nr:CHAP domain-containing protein [Candidatus Moranbacteria bacterium]
MDKFVKSVLVAVSLLISLVTNSFAGDSQCKGFTSEANPFLCYSHGNCVWWAAYRRPDLKAFMNHSAKFWYNDAINTGFNTGYQPRVGSVVVFNSWGNNDNGHVAYVESVNGDGSFGASEMDFTGGWGDGQINTTYYPSSGGYKHGNGTTTLPLLGFIYPKYCTFLNSATGVFCWNGTNGYFAECEDGKSFTLYKRQNNGTLTTTNLSNSAGLNYCARMTVGDFPNAYSVDLGAYKGGNAAYAAYGGWSSGSGVSNSFNLKVNSFTAVDSSGNTLIGDQSLVKTGQAITVKAQVKAVNGNTINNMHPGKSTIEVDLYARTDENSWVFQKRDYVQATNLYSGATHTENLTYTIPNGVSSVSFKFKIDAEDEAYEANEGDNWSGIKTFQVDFSWLIPIINIILED